MHQLLLHNFWLLRGALSSASREPLDCNEILFCPPLSRRRTLFTVPYSSRTVHLDFPSRKGLSLATTLPLNNPFKTSHRPDFWCGTGDDAPSKMAEDIHKTKGRGIGITDTRRAPFRNTATATNSLASRAFGRRCGHRAAAVGAAMPPPCS